MDLINKNFKLTKISYPYEIWVIDNFLKEKVIEDIQNHWPSQGSNSWHSGYSMVENQSNILEHKMRGISKLELMPKNIAKIMEHFHSKEFIQQLQSIISQEDLLPDESMRWSGLRVMLENSFQLIHSDARYSPETGLVKYLTCLLYTNKHFDEQNDYGFLEIWNDEMTKCEHKIAPNYNRFVVFVNSDKSYHGVPKVSFERRAITFSVMKNLEVTSKRHKALFVPRSSDSEEVRLQAEKRLSTGK